MIRFEKCIARRRGSEHRTELKRRSRSAELRLLALIFGLISIPAYAQESLTIADIRCMIVGMELSALTDSQSQSRGIFMTLYYMGRIRGRTPKLIIEDLTIEEANKMPNGELASEEKRCLTDLAEAGVKLTQIGKDIIERKAKMPTLPNAPAN